MAVQLSPNDIARIKQFLDQISPSPERPLTVMESGRGGPGINIPLTKQTDPSQFPRWEFREYPKMLVHRATKDDHDDHVRRKALDETMGAPPCYKEGKQSWIPIPSTSEHVASGFADALGGPLIMQTKEQEEEFLGVFPEVAKIIEVPLVIGDLVRSESQADRIKRENAELEELVALRKRNAELRAQLDEPLPADANASAERQKRKYTRRAKPGEQLSDDAGGDPEPEVGGDPWAGVKSDNPPPMEFTLPATLD